MYVGYILGVCDDILTHVNSRLDVIQDWYNVNKLSINPAISEFMLVTTENNNIIPEHFIGHDRINVVNSFKYLCVHIDKSLKFQMYFNNVKSKLSRM